MPSIIPTLTLTLIYALLLFPNPTYSIDSPGSSPSPSPQLPPPSTSPAFPHSPPAPPPTVSAPDSPSPAPSVHKKSPSPAPYNYVAADQAHVGDLDSKDGSDGMSGGKKAGIAIGVIAGGCVVGVAALVYKKRQHNIRRGQYGYAARGEFL